MRHVLLVGPTLHGQKTEVPDLAVSARQVTATCGHATSSEIAETSGGQGSFALFAEAMLSL